MRDAADQRREHQRRDDHFYQLEEQPGQDRKGIRDRYDDGWICDCLVDDEADDDTKDHREEDVEGNSPGHSRSPDKEASSGRGKATSRQAVVAEARGNRCCSGGVSV
jgi:hypothetical protein